jgi:hypothetical protein
MPLVPVTVTTAPTVECSPRLVEARQIDIQYQWRAAPWGSGANSPVDTSRCAFRGQADQPEVPSDLWCA